MFPVLLLFLIPIGGGIPAGVLLAEKHRLSWPVTSSLYFVSDVLLAIVFEPVLMGLIALGRKLPRLAHAANVMRLSIERTAAQYGGPSAGPLTLVLIAFGVDPMTGRAAAAAAGHGFFSGWAVAITGDMLYFWVIMAATLKLSAALGDPNRAVFLVLLAMIAGPVLVRKAKEAWFKRRA